MSGSQTYANAEVLEFYKTLPFNYRDSVEGSIQAIRETDQLAAYPILKPLLNSDVTVLDVGCGAGWLSNSIAFRHGAAVAGIDFNPVAVQRAREVGEAMGLKTHFETADLFTYEPEQQFDIVVSIGVLHHTNNCHAALRRIFSRYLKPGGHAFIGLYHSYGRKPLLDHFEEMKRSGASEDEMLTRYRQLHSQLKDQTHLLSWFRDQVLHPHETQHTLEEMEPILKESGMKLISTSINKFQPIGKVEELFPIEMTYLETARQRLKENQYFTGFFVFLAQKKDESEPHEIGKVPKGFVDAKRYIEHDPLCGYRYTPGADYVLPRPDGGKYHIKINSHGVRSDREYEFEKPKGFSRIIVCGDSMTAGQYVANAQRFSELLERRIPHLEIINLALEGSGTDQELLLYEQAAKKYAHDIVVVFPFLQNIRRNMAKARLSYDPETKEAVLLPKPWFELENSRLVLKGTPVPKERQKISDSSDKQILTDTDEQSGIAFRMKSVISRMAAGRFLKKFIYAAMRWEPFPEYKSADTKEWRLMAAILRRFKEVGGDRPLIIAPLFYEGYLRFRMARNYWDRYKSLESLAGIQVIDMLPHFKKLGADGSKCFQEPYDCHFSTFGHLALADALEEELRARALLP